MSDCDTKYNDMVDVQIRFDIFSGDKNRASILRWLSDIMTRV